MARPAMRKLVLLLSFLAVGVALDVPSVAAQGDAAVVQLTLLSQTPWNSSYEEGGRELVIRFRAENIGATPLEELSVGVTLYPRLISRTALEESLITDPGFPLVAATYPREGGIGPADTRDFQLVFPLDSGGIDPIQSGVYPLKIDLRTGGTTSLAALRTPVVFLVRPPEEPLRLSWTFVLHHPIEFRPDGVFTSTSLEDSLSRGGELSGQIRALLALATRPPQPPVDLVIAPMLLRQLAMMRDGYEVVVAGEVREVEAREGGSALADGALEDLGRVADAANVRVSALPFSTPELPSLIAAGLGGDVNVQLERGRQLVSELLGTTPMTNVLRPPGGALDDATLRELSSAGVSILVAGAETVENEPHPLGFAGPPTATLGEDGEMRVIIPDPAIETLLESSVATTDPVDPVRAAQTVVGALASIWQERPGQLRGIAFVVSEDAILPGRFYPPFTRAISGAPWLTPMHAGEFTAAFEPREPSVLAPSVPSRFTATYIDELRQARRRISTYRSMLVDESEQPERLDTMLLLAESRQYLSDPADGLVFVADVRDAVSAVFRSVTVDTADVITLTSSRGSGIPVTVRNGAETALRFRLQLESDFLLGTPPNENLELGPSEARTVTFRVNARATGRFDADLLVLAPGGRIIGRRELTIRSTVYNRIALAITLAAALVLLALWARRFIPRRTS
jgi:hypothetical protein